MREVRLLLPIISLYLTLCLPAAAQETWVDSTNTSRTRWTVVPIFFSSPDTRIGVGAVPHIVFHTSPNTRQSNAKLEVSYTQNGQFNLRLSSNLWMPGDLYGVDAKIQFQDWPATFYGIGNNVSADRKEKYSSRIMVSTTELQREIAPQLYAGFRHDIRHDEIHSVEDGGMLDSGEVRGSRGGISVGMGAFVSYDTRDAVLYPTEGVLLRAGSRLFLRAWGSDWNYARYRLEGRSYLHLDEKRVLAAQVVAAFASGEPPFQMYSSVGELLRAYGSTRYIDKNMLAARLEFRHTPVLWRFGHAFFISAGGVAPSLGAFDVGSFHLSAGVGIRFQLIPSEQVLLRWDFAVGTRTTGTYLDIGEAF